MLNVQQTGGTVYFVRTGIRAIAAAIREIQLIHALLLDPLTSTVASYKSEIARLVSVLTYQPRAHPVTFLEA